MDMNDERFNDLHKLNLPENIMTRIAQIRHTGTQRMDSDFHHQVGSPGYIAPNPTILYDAIVAMATGKNILLKGPTGSGKTKLAEYLSFIFNKPMHSINCSVDLDIEGILGFKTLSYAEGQSAGTGTTKIEFVDGPVVKAMKQGHVLYVDEINMARPETLPIMNGVLDYRRRVTNPFTGDVVTAAPGFQVVAALNMGYVGTVPLNEALKNRFVVIDIPYLEGQALQTVLEEQTALRDAETLRLFVQFFTDVLAQTKTGQLPDETASIRGLLDACDLAANIPPSRAVMRAIAAKLDDDRERQLVMNLAETYF